jgi:hypothetical protein
MRERHGKRAKKHLAHFTARSRIPDGQTAFVKDKASQLGVRTRPIGLSHASRRSKEKRHDSFMALLKRLGPTRAN